MIMDGWMGGGIIRREKETHKMGEVHGQLAGQWVSVGGRDDKNKISPGFNGWFYCGR